MDVGAAYVIASAITAPPAYLTIIATWRKLGRVHDEVRSSNGATTGQTVTATNRKVIELADEVAEVRQDTSDLAVQFGRFLRDWDDPYGP